MIKWVRTSRLSIKGCGCALDERADFVDLGALPHAVLHVQIRLGLERLEVGLESVKVDIFMAIFVLQNRSIPYHNFADKTAIVQIRLGLERLPIGVFLGLEC